MKLPRQYILTKTPTVSNGVKRKNRWIWKDEAGHPYSPVFKKLSEALEYPLKGVMKRWPTERELLRKPFTARELNDHAAYHQPIVRA